MCLLVFSQDKVKKSVRTINGPYLGGPHIPSASSGRLHHQNLYQNGVPPTKILFYAGDANKHQFYHHVHYKILSKVSNFEHYAHNKVVSTSIFNILSICSIGFVACFLK